MFKRGYVGTYHQMSEAHLHRYVNEGVTGRHNIRPLDTAEQMGRVADGMVGKRLRYDECLIATSGAGEDHSSGSSSVNSHTSGAQQGIDAVTDGLESGVMLAGGQKASIVSGIDDHSRFVVSSCGGAGDVSPDV